MPNTDFTLKPEERCGHYVDSDIKKLWSVQLDLLEQVKLICKKHNINYYALGGTLLGAIRHKGYIPWDDDIDICMLADEYERFCKIAPYELTGKYYFQIASDMARIRNSNTTAVTGGDLKKLRFDKNHNCGIFIDIFPLHNIFDSKCLRMMQKFVLYILDRMSVGREKEELLNSNFKKYWKFYFSKAVLLWKGFSLFYDYEDYFTFKKSAVKMCKKSNRLGLVSFMGIKEKYMWDAKWFSEGIECTFENTTVFCPKEYDSILRQQYGDYMVFKKGGALHTMEVFDAEVPYREKLKEYYKE